LWVGSSHFVELTIYGRFQFRELIQLNILMPVSDLWLGFAIVLALDRKNWGIQVTQSCVGLRRVEIFQCAEKNQQIVMPAWLQASNGF
jgi:hypothetical protein